MPLIHPPAPPKLGAARIAPKATPAGLRPPRQPPPLLAHDLLFDPPERLLYPILLAIAPPRLVAITLVITSYEAAGLLTRVPAAAEIARLAAAPIQLPDPPRNRLLTLPPGAAAAAVLDTAPAARGARTDLHRGRYLIIPVLDPASLGRLSELEPMDRVEFR